MSEGFDPFVVFWTFMILTSIFWYGFLIFYVGVKAGKEIKELTQALTRRSEKGEQ
jgi:hypothetical protein